MKLKSKKMPIFSMKLAGNLMQKGFPMLYTRRNKRFPDKVVYYFHDTPELHTAIEAYLSAR